MEGKRKTYDFSIELLQFGVFLVCTAKAIVGHSAEGHSNASSLNGFNPVISSSMQAAFYYVDIVVVQSKTLGLTVVVVVRLADKAGSTALA